MKTIVLLFALTLLCGCAKRPGDRYEVVVDSSAGYLLADDVLMATDMWASKVPVHFDVSVADDCKVADGRICVHSTDHAGLLRIRPDAPNMWAVTKFPPLGSFGRPDGADVYIDDAWIYPRLLHLVIAHELGHAMGLEHTGPGTIMCGDGGCLSNTVTDIDAQQWYDVRR